MSAERMCREEDWVQYAREAVAGPKGWLRVMMCPTVSESGNSARDQRIREILEGCIAKIDLLTENAEKDSAEIDRLTAALETKDVFLKTAIDHDAELQGDNARLREALTDITTATGCTEGTRTCEMFKAHPDLKHVYARIVFARAALEGAAPTSDAATPGGKP